MSYWNADEYSRLGGPALNGLQLRKGVANGREANDGLKAMC